MKAVMKTGPGEGNIVVDRAPRPTVRSGEALVRVTSAGICGTDLSLVRWNTSVVSQYHSEFPFILGHEFGGVVEQSSDRDGALPVGTVVGVNPQLTCRRCIFCVTGLQTNCVERALLGTSIDGGLAEYVTIPEENLYEVGHALPEQDAALFEPLAVAVHAVIERAPTRLGDIVVVLGCGPIGLLTAILALHSGAKQVLITGLAEDEFRLQLAEALGATAISVSETDLIQHVAEHFASGVDIVYETSGSNQVLDEAIAVMKPQGRICLIGLAAQPSTFGSAQAVIRELTIIGSRGYNDETFAQAQQILPTVAPQIRQVVTHYFALEEFTQGLDLIAGDTHSAGKIIFLPTTSALSQS